jgi:hypothetical protein
VVGVVGTIGAIICFAIVAKIGVFVFEFKIMIEIVFLVAGFVWTLALEFLVFVGNKEFVAIDAVGQESVGQRTNSIEKTTGNKFATSGAIFVWKLANHLKVFDFLQTHTIVCFRLRRHSDGLVYHVHSRFWWW